jgi:hypothetical protein
VNENENKNYSACIRTVLVTSRLEAAPPITELSGKNTNDTQASNKSQSAWLCVYSLRRLLMYRKQMHLETVLAGELARADRALVLGPLAAVLGPVGRQARRIFVPLFTLGTSSATYNE